MNYKDLSRKELRKLTKKLDKRNEKLEGGGYWRNWDFVISTVAVLVFAFSIRAVIAEPVRVKGSSMEGTLYGGDYLLVEKLSYDFSAPKRGDIIICYYPDEYYEHYHSNEETNSCVKRVIGESGDTVTIAGGSVFVNGVKLDESYLSPGTITYASRDSYVVPEGCLMVMGDNRGVSADSRNEYVSFIPYERVLGRARYLVSPIKRAKSLSSIDYEGL